MAARLRTHLAMFGDVGLVREFCQACESMAIVLDDRLQCCDAPAKGKPDHWKRISEASEVRKSPPAALKAAILEQQENRCIYCERRFGSWVRRRSAPRSGLSIRLLVTWDHFVPFSFVRSNPDENFVAACQVCNGIKRDKLFGTVEEARVFIATRREAKYEDA